MDKKLLLVALLVALVEISHSSPLSPGVWEDHLRFRREQESYTDTPEPGTTGASRTKRGADDGTGSAGDESTPEPTSPSRSRREANKNCSEDLKSNCKADACPMDDASMETCCKCFETCCSSDSASKEGSTSEPEPSSEPSSVESATDSAKKYVNETVTNIKNKAENAATKVEGWFKNVGQSIKQGVGTAVEKVKTTANTVKESAKSGINKAADWVKNKTSSDGKSSSCVEGKSAKGALTTTPTNFKDAVNCTVEEVSTKAGEMSGMTDDSSESTTENRRKRNSEESSDMTTSSSTRETNSSTKKVPGMRKSKRSLEEVAAEESLKYLESSGGRYRRDAADEATTELMEGSTDDSATEDTATESTSKSNTIIIHASGQKGSKNNDNNAPIRAPGSVDPEEATVSKNSTTKVSYGLTVISGQGGSNHLEASIINKDFIKPGRCRPLNQGLKCITLSRDATQCTYDAMCPDNKKCCFYACNPNADVGICEHPVLSN